METFYEKSQEPVAVETEAFRIVGMKKEEEAVSVGTKKKKGPKLPVISLVVLVLILAGCLIFPFFIKKISRIYCYNNISRKFHFYVCLFDIY